MKPIGERDWKRFVVLKERALERYCRTTLSDVAGLCAQLPGTGGDQALGPSAHERFRDVYWLVRERNRQIARAFDGHSRSRAPLQFLALVEMGLLTGDEIDEFSDDMRSLLPQPHLTRNDV